MINWSERTKQNNVPGHKNNGTTGYQCPVEIIERRSTDQGNQILL